ncbi:hypothetical protein C8J56DRAFT_172013 [Mycena floridula]|nr:hypothetical protein C8J56DRAFT_172013 [Mycena floridula]
MYPRNNTVFASKPRGDHIRPMNMDRPPPRHAVPTSFVESEYGSAVPLSFAAVWDAKHRQMAVWDGEKKEIVPYSAGTTHGFSDRQTTATLKRQSFEDEGFYEYAGLFDDNNGLFDEIDALVGGIERLRYQEDVDEQDFSGHPDCEPELPSRFSSTTTSTSNYITVDFPPPSPIPVVPDLDVPQTPRVQSLGLAELAALPTPALSVLARGFPQHLEEKKEIPEPVIHGGNPLISGPFLLGPAPRKPVVSKPILPRKTAKSSPSPRGQAQAQAQTSFTSQGAESRGPYGDAPSRPHAPRSNTSPKVSSPFSSSTTLPGILKGSESSPGSVQGARPLFLSLDGQHPASNVSGVQQKSSALTISTSPSSTKPSRPSPLTKSRDSPLAGSMSLPTRTSPSPLAGPKTAFPLLRTATSSSKLSTSSSKQQSPVSPLISNVLGVFKRRPASPEPRQEGWVHVTMIDKRPTKLL